MTQSTYIEAQHLLTSTFFLSNLSGPRTEPLLHHFTFLDITYTDTLKSLGLTKRPTAQSKQFEVPLQASKQAKRSLAATMRQT
jgi:hypothetical protein